MNADYSIFENAINEAETGKRIIDGCRKPEYENQVFVIFPDDDSDLLESAFRFLDRVASESDYTSILTSIEGLVIRDHIHYPFECVYVSEAEMDCILRFASMAQIEFPAIKIASLRKPANQRGEMLPGTGNITMDMAVARGLYSIFGELP